MMHLWKLLDFIERVLRKIVETRRQNDRDKLENDPAKWFDDHFDSGLRDDNDKAETNKTDDRPDKG